jgi:prepilin-type N-terminal cleavage/methylation domain-containing protein
MIARRARNSGFSLIELLCAMAVGSIVLLAAAGLLGSSGENYRRASGGISAQREARAALDRLAADLANARFHADSVFGRSPADWPADRLGFLCLMPADAQSAHNRIGDLCAVHWKIADRQIGGKTVRCLMRGVRESAETFTALGENRIPTLFAPRPTTDEPVAFGVLSFEARPKTSDASGRWIDWTPDADTAGPRALDVRLVVARPTLAARLERAGDWNDESLLGLPENAGQNPELEIHTALIRFGNHEKP